MHLISLIWFRNLAKPQLATQNLRHLERVGIVYMKENILESLVLESLIIKRA